MALDVPPMGSKPELPDYLAEQAGGGTNALACLGHFFRGGERHGGQFSHLRGIVGNLFAGGGLFTSGRGGAFGEGLGLTGALDNLREHLVSFFGTQAAVFDAAAAGFNGSGGAGCLLLNSSHHAGDFFCRGGGVLGEAAHFSGDNGEAASLLPRRARLDGGIQGQQIGVSEISRMVVTTLLISCERPSRRPINARISEEDEAISPIVCAAVAMTAACVSAVCDDSRLASAACTELRAISLPSAPAIGWTQHLLGQFRLAMTVPELHRV